MKQLTAVFSQDTKAPMLGIIRPDYTCAKVLAANTEATLTVPEGAKYVNMSSTDDFYAAYDATAAVPGSDVTDGTAPELNPGMRDISGVATLHLISGTACIVTLSFFK